MPDEEFRNEVKAAHEFASWTSRLSALDTPLLQPFLLTPNAVGDFEFVSRAAVAGVSSAFTGYRDDYRNLADPNVVLAITILPFPTIAAAHEALVDLLCLSMAPRLLRADTRGVMAGHIGFVGYGELIDRIYFVRRNILVRVENIGSTLISVREVAEEIDRRIIAQQDRP